MEFVDYDIGLGGEIGYNRPGKGTDMSSLILRERIKKAVAGQPMNSSLTRIVLMVLVCVIGLLSASVKGVTAEDKKSQTQPFLYTQDFEEIDSVSFQVSDGEYTVNFKGLTEEKAYSGKKSFKLDVTFKKGSFFYWEIPIRIPAEGRLQFSGRLLLGEETTGRVGLGANVIFPPTTHSGLNSFSIHTKEDWQLIREEDIAKWSKKLAHAVFPLAWEANEENVGVYVYSIGLFLWGREGQRVVVYVDDIKIEGEVPGEEDYKEEINRRWSPAKAKIDEKICSWEKALDEIEDSLTALINLSPESEKTKNEVEQKTNSLRAKVEEIKKKGFINLSEQKEIDTILEQLKDIISNIKQILAGKPTGKIGKDYLVYVLSPITGSKVLPFESFVPGKISNEISLIACPGEYEPGSFVVSALSDINSLMIEPTDLKSKDGVIPIENLDIKIVKCWYQAGSAWSNVNQDKTKKELVPELLLNDDSLVKVDYQKQENYLKLALPEGEKYIWISNPKNTEGVGRLSLEEYPVKDSPALLPVNIPAKTNQQFWVTVRVPEKAEPGIYTGKLNLKTSDKTIGELNLRLKIFPFKLSAPYYTSSLFYRGKLDPTGKGSISSELKNEKQFRKEQENMFSHGVTNPTVYQPFDEKLLGEVLRIRNEVGMDKQSLYYLNEDWQNMEGRIPIDMVEKTIEFVKSFGISEIFFYGQDEAAGEGLKSQRDLWMAIRQAGGKILASGYRGEHFSLVGDIQDVFVCAFYPSREEAAKWHSAGHKIWCYANPQAGVENPEVYRRNYGLLLWKYNYDGAGTYGYHHSFGNIWNDFDDPSYRDHNFTYPTVDGVIDTIAWEGYREGVDDVRYLTTLIQAIEKVKETGSAKAKKVAAEAEKYLETLDVESRDLDTVRVEIIGYILKLKEGEK